MIMSNVMKKLGMAILLLMAVVLSAPLSVDAATSKSMKGWEKEYLKIATKIHEEDKKNNYSAGHKPFKYNLIYFDGDSVPELVINQSGYRVSMYTYDKNKKKAYCVISDWPYGAFGNSGYWYLPKKNVLQNIDSDCAGAIINVYYGKMKNHKIVDYYKKNLEEWYFKDKNGNGYPDEGEYTSTPIYYYGGKKISKKKFESYKIEGNYKMIEGKYYYTTLKKKLKHT